VQCTSAEEHGAKTSCSTIVTECNCCTAISGTDEMLTAWAMRRSRRTGPCVHGFPLASCVGRMSLQSFANTTCRLISPLPVLSIERFMHRTGSGKVGKEAGSLISHYGDGRFSYSRNFTHAHNRTHGGTWCAKNQSPEDAVTPLSINPAAQSSRSINTFTATAGCPVTH
jgi:hypothetical protein